MDVRHMAKHALCIVINDYPGTGGEVSSNVYDAIRKALLPQQSPQTSNLSGSNSMTA